MDWFNFITTILTIFYIITVIAVIVGVILENRSPYRTLAWILAIVLLPVIGILWYLYFGIDYRKKRLPERLRKLYRDNFLRYVRSQNIDDASDNPHERQFMHLQTACPVAILTSHNRITILENGEETFPAVFEAMERAERFIHFESYIVEDGELTNRLLAIFTEKVKEGVEVRMIIDDVGSWHLSHRTKKAFRKAGVQVRYFLPVHFPFLSRRANYRNHRKIIIIDGKKAFTGGLNFADRYLYGMKHKGIWRDTHLAVEGEAVVPLQAIFFTDWFFVSGDSSENTDAYFYKNPAGNSAVQIVTSGPESQLPVIQHSYFSLINLALRRLFISTPYLVPDGSISMALKSAALAGVEVRLLIPNCSDNQYTYWCNRSFFSELLDAGVHIHLYTKGFNHQKVLIVDQNVASVGSANLDIRSFEQNFECNVVLYDNALIQQLADHFLSDLRTSEEIDAVAWHNRPKGEKRLESFARLLAPVL